MIERLQRETKMKWAIHEETLEPFANGDNYFYWVEPFNDGYKLQWANMFVARSPERVMSFDELVSKINRLEGFIVNPSHNE
jgi:hypothetical protein